MWWLVKQPTPLAPMVDQFTRNAAAAVFLGAALIQGATWRRTRESYLLWTALALIVIGLKFPLGTALGLGPWQRHPAVEPALVVRLALVFTVILLAALALAGSIRPLRQQSRRLVRWLLLVSGSTAAAVLASGPVGLPILSEMQILRSAEWLATASWVALTIAFFRHGRANRRTRCWGSAGLGLMAIVEFAHALDLAGPVRLLEYSSGVQLLAALLAIRAALARIRTDWTSSDFLARELSGRLWVARRDLHSAERRESERLHDARTAIFSLIAASELLAEQDLGMEQHDRRPLAGLMSSELRRLSGLMETTGDQPVQSFSLSHTLPPLVFAARLGGLDVRLDDADCWVLGRECAFTSAVANVLTNARVHAPGSTVTVDVRRSGPRVIIRIADDGPGVPPIERRRLLERGVRGSASRGPGSGLGLYTAAKAVADQGGSLELAETPGGGTTVLLTLPACDAPAPASIPLVNTADDRPRVPISSGRAISGG
jgi:signal transduction histidine kinase